MVSGLFIQGFKNSMIQKFKNLMIQDSMIFMTLWG